MNLPENRKVYSRPNILCFVREGALRNRNYRNSNDAVQLARELM